MAVYTHVNDDELRDFLTAYDLGFVTSFKGIAEGVENTNYILRTEGGNFILTLYEKRVSANELPFFLNLMSHLSERGIPCPTPVLGRDGRLFNQLCDRPAALVSFVEGVSLLRPQPGHCGEVGRVLAQMHVAGADFKGARANNLSLSGWGTLARKCMTGADDIQPGLGDLLARELEFLSENWPSQLPSGVIHADLFTDNVFFQGDNLSGVIDFYFACNEQLIYDLAICLNAWCFERDLSFNATKAKRLMSAYHSVRPLNKEEVDAMPLFARGAAFRFLLTRLYDWLNRVEGALVEPKDPLEYARKLNFHQRVSGPGEYGLS